MLERPGEGVRFPELELQVGVSRHVGTRKEPRSSGRINSALKHQAICLAPLQSELLQGNPEGLMDSLKTTHTGLGLATPPCTVEQFDWKVVA